MSQPLQEAALTWKTQMDRFLAQAVRPVLKLATPYQKVPPDDHGDHPAAPGQEQQRIERVDRAEGPREEQGEGLHDQEEGREDEQVGLVQPAGRD